MTAGQDFVKKIRPVGCVLLLALGVIVTVLCFTHNSDPIKGYQPPEDTAYYAANPQALVQELEKSVFPALEGEEQATVTSDGKVRVSVDAEHYILTRGAILQYFDSSLLEFEQPEETAGA